MDPPKRSSSVEAGHTLSAAFWADSNFLDSRMGIDSDAGLGLVLAPFVEHIPNPLPVFVEPKVFGG